MAWADLANAAEDWKGQVDILRDAIKAMTSAIPPAQALAHLLATCPDSAVRDGKEAVRLAEAICDANGYQRHASVCVPAEAYAEANPLVKAVDAATQAVRLARRAGKSDLVAQYRVRLDLFEAKKPYRSNK